MSLQYQETAVTVNIGNKPFTKSYKQVVRGSLTVEDMLNMLQDPKNARSVIDDWHYGQDLRAKADVRKSILDSMADSPEAAFEKNVKAFMEYRKNLGKPVTEEKAREIVKLQGELE